MTYIKLIYYVFQIINRDEATHYKGIQSMQEMITLGFLFDRQHLFTKTRKPGSSDGIDLGLGVSPDLEAPGVWSGILNLCARLCFEVVSFDAPLIVNKDQISEKKACLVIDLLTESPGLCTQNPEFVSIEKTDARQVCIQSGSAPALGMILNYLAMGSLERPDAPPHCIQTKGPAHRDFSAPGNIVRLSA